jgi:hypothetical protein
MADANTAATLLPFVGFSGPPLHSAATVFGPLFMVTSNPATDLTVNVLPTSVVRPSPLIVEGLRLAISCGKKFLDVEDHPLVYVPSVLFV